MSGHLHERHSALKRSRTKPHRLWHDPPQMTESRDTGRTATVGHRRSRREPVTQAASQPEHTHVTVLPHLITGSGAPVVLLPGLGPHHTGSRAHQRALQRLEVAHLARSFTVWIIARPTGLRHGTSIRVLADLYAATIRSRFDGPVDLVGVSTGGSIALQLAIDHPTVLKRLVLVSAASRLGNEGRAAQRDIATHLRNGRPRRAAATMLAATTTRRSKRALRRMTGLALGRVALGNRPADLIALLEAEDRFDVTAELHRVTAPTLLIGSGRDGYYPTDLFRKTAFKLPHGALTQFARKGHLDLTTDRAVATAIADFLKTDSSP